MPSWVRSLWHILMVPFAVRRTDLGALVLLRIGGFFSLFFLAAVLIMGLLRMGQGALEVFGLNVAAREGSEVIFVRWKLVTTSADPQLGISSLMSGLEFFLLAPLGYLLLRTLGNYVNAIRKHPRGYADAETVGALMSVKGLSTGLLIAVLATHLVAEFLHKEHGEEFPWVKVLSGGAILSILVVYFHVIESLCHQRSEHSELKVPEMITNERRKEFEAEFGQEDRDGGGI